MDNQGWIAIHRQLQDSDIWSKPHEWLKIWMFILLNVSYENKRYPRGTYFFRYHWIADRTGTTYDQVRRCIDYLKVSHSIATQKATQGIIITVLNFAKYQDITKFKSQTENPSHATQKPRGSHNTTNNATMQQETNNIYSGAEAPTPSQIMTKFINEPEEQEKVILALEGRGMARETSSAEIKKFLNYWCELTKSGKQQRWQTEKTFELQRRLATWFNNAQKFNKTNIIKSL